jgi:hypothetical protein
MQVRKPTSLPEGSEAVTRPVASAHLTGCSSHIDYLVGARLGFFEPYLAVGMGSRPKFNAGTEMSWQ